MNKFERSSQPPPSIDSLSLSAGLNCSHLFSCEFFFFFLCLICFFLSRLSIAKFATSIRCDGGVATFHFTAGIWKQVGSTIGAKEDGMRFDRSVAVSHDSQRIVATSFLFDSHWGNARVFDLVEREWVGSLRVKSRVPATIWIVWGFWQLWLGLVPRWLGLDCWGCVG